MSTQGAELDPVHLSPIPCGSSLPQCAKTWPLWSCTHLPHGTEIHCVKSDGVLWDWVLPRLEHRKEEEVISGCVWLQPSCLEPLTLRLMKQSSLILERKREM